MNNNERKLSTLAKDFVFDLFFPPLCIDCGKFINRAEGKDLKNICFDCRQKIKIQNGFSCAFCLAPVVNGLTCPFCRRDHSLSQLLVTASYEQPIVKSTVKMLKYDFIKSLGDDLASIMVSYLTTQIDRKIINLSGRVIVPVPLSRRRLRWRGFNQAEVLATNLAAAFSLEMCDAIIRISAHKPQADIQNKKDRIENIKNSFACPAPHAVKNKKVLLVDDVSTTGSTLEECAKVLKSAGALQVTALVFARG